MCILRYKVGVTFSHIPFLERMNRMCVFLQRRGGSRAVVHPHFDHAIEPGRDHLRSARAGLVGRL
jgi:hypothetical protein